MRIVVVTSACPSRAETSSMSPGGDQRGRVRVAQAVERGRVLDDLAVALDRLQPGALDGAREYPAGDVAVIVARLRDTNARSCGVVSGEASLASRSIATTAGVISIVRRERFVLSGTRLPLRSS